jgi:MFS family permease
VPGCLFLFIFHPHPSTLPNSSLTLNNFSNTYQRFNHTRYRYLYNTVRYIANMEHAPIETVVKNDTKKVTETETETIFGERRDSRTELTDKDAVAASKLGFAFSDTKKWAILTVIFWVQISMNYNAAIYGNAVPGMSKDFGISHFQARLGQMAFLVAYGFGCEFWAPFSEELGRKWIMQASLGLVNIFQIPCMLSTNFNTVLAARIFGGLSSAGGSVTLGMVADMFGPENQQFAMLYVVFSSCAGSVVAPIVGGFITQYLDWRWVFYTQLIFGAVVQVIHLFSVPETRASVLLDHEAQRRRKSGEDANVYGPNEIRGSFWKRLDGKHVLKLMWRPYLFLSTEPVVAFLSLLSGFSDALIFTGLDSFALVLGQWNFTPSQVGLSFIP